MFRILLAGLILLSSPAFADTAVFFSPYDDLEAPFVDIIKNAKKSIKISCFGLNNEAIFNALVERKKAGVKILVLEDKMQSAGKHDYRDKMRAAGIEVVVKKVQVLEHNKEIWADGLDCIIGSFNLSESAKKQDNSIVVFRNEPDICGQVSGAMDRIYERDK